MSLNVEQVPGPRRDILYFLKRNGRATIAELAAELQMTGEAVRQHLLLLKQENLINRYSEKTSSVGAGRPSQYYSLTGEGEHLFPKYYDLLTIELLDTMLDQLGPKALIQILSAITEKKVREWEPHLFGLDLNERLTALKNLYMENDEFIEIEHTHDEIRFIERNCPYANVAMKRPALCSVSVNVLSRLLGFNVVREKSFQNGDGQCAFLINLNHPIDTASFSFSMEDQIQKN